MTNIDVKVEALGSAMHSGMFGGAAPDPLAALIAILASLRDEHGDTTINGLDNTQTWAGVDYPQQQFRADAEVLDGVDLIGSGSVADRLWARPAVTVLGIDVPPIIGSAAAIQASAAARVSLRVPPGMDGKAAQDIHAEFQAAGFFLTHILECPLVPGENGPANAGDLLRKHLPAVASRIRRSLKPKHVMLVTEMPPEVVQDIVALDLGCEVILNDGKPFALTPLVKEAEILRFRALLDSRAMR
jgi:acetylornithine deacetylase/succinyl-diaminopimelate desuccinylase-like protein